MTFSSIDQPNNLSRLSPAATEDVPLTQSPHLQHNFLEHLNNRMSTETTLEQLQQMKAEAIHRKG